MSAIVIRTLIIYLTLMISLRFLGKRQIGELEISELIVTFMLSELATAPIADASAPLLCAIIPILLLLSLEGILSFATIKLPFFKKLLYGKPSILIYDGRLDQKELEKQRIELSELICAVRQSGILSLGDVQYAILEENGKISVFPRGSDGTPSEPGGDRIGLPFIIDGRIITENLTACGWSTGRLRQHLAEHRTDERDIFFLSPDSSGGLYIIKKEEKR